jgi:hypothetical protein
MLEVTSSKIRLVFSVFNTSQEKKTNFYFERNMGYFKDQDTIVGLNSMIEYTGS